MGFAGGHNGRLLADLAQGDGLHSSWTWINAETRTCTILVSEPGDSTLINEPGAPVSASDWKRFQQKVVEQLPIVGQVCISGSLPPDSSAEDFQGLLDLLVNGGKQVWVDTSGIGLRTALGHPNVGIKVNSSEIGEILGIKVKDLESAQRSLNAMDHRGLTASVITLGSEGALLASREGRWYARGPQVEVVSTVGSGDAFLGGLVGALDAGRDFPEALQDAVAAGTANALLPGGGHFKLQDFEKIRRQVQIQSW
jgi:1-phosphofructokinase family hexose kinase